MYPKSQDNKINLDLINEEKAFRKLKKENKFLSLCPDPYAKIKDYQELFKSVDPETKEIERDIIVIFDNQFIQTCDEQQIELYEKLVKIEPNRNLSLEVRRFNVLFIYQSILPYTLPKLKEQLNSLCGYENWIILQSLNTYEMMIQILESFDDMMETMLQAFIPIIPCHIKWGMLKEIVVSPKENTYLYFGGYNSINITYDIIENRINEDINLKNLSKINMSSVSSQYKVYNIKEN